MEPKLTNELRIPRDEAKVKLQDRIKKGHEIKGFQINSSESINIAEKEYSKWSSYNIELLKQIFTSEELSLEYQHCNFIAFSISDENYLNEAISKYYKYIDQEIHIIDSIIERLELIPLSHAASNVETKAKESFNSQAKTKKVFIVHGHDKIAKTNLEVFLHEIGLEPIVLHRQADEGQTIIEKFEKHSDVSYAFILLTPDEIAYIKADENKNDNERKEELMARPNVIFEFGYFVGKLGRSRVCCLYTGDVSLPSDVNGIIYKKFTSSIDEVAYSITKDLKASGYSIN